MYSLINMYIQPCYVTKTKLSITSSFLAIKDKMLLVAREVDKPQPVNIIQYYSTDKSCLSPVDSKRQLPQR